MPYSISAQTTADTGNLRQLALNNAKEKFNNAIGRQSSFYNGPIYFLYNPKIRGSAYFNESITLRGNVLYDGMEYKNVPLIYDLSKDKLVSLLYGESSYFELLKDNVQQFDLAGHHFVNISTDTVSDPNITGGYYEELYSGPTRVLVKITKRLHESSSSTGTPDAYSFFTEPVSNFFVRKGNAYYRITSQGSLLNVLKDKKQQLKKYIKTSGIKFSKDQGKAMAEIASYYDRLSN